MNKTVSRNRLLKLANFLDKLPRKRFCYSTWVGADWEGNQDLSCGTTACALGWAATMPEFRRLGLNLKSDNYFCNYVSLKKKNKEVAIDLDAASEVFGLGMVEAEYLFCPEHDDGDGNYSPGDNATPKQVAKHIRKFVKEHR